MNHIPPLKLAVDIKGMRPLAKAIGVSYQSIQKYLKGQVPAEQVRPISEATDWKVTPHQLRPDLYPHPSDGLPEHLRVDSAAVAS